MFWRRYYVREASSMTLNDTFRLTLPDHGRLGSLLLRITGSEKSAYGQGGGAWRIIDEISKIEVIVNGSQVVKSITGIAAHALAHLDQGVTCTDRWRNYATNMQACNVLINFGRNLFDRDLQLDLSKYDSVELKISNTASSSTDFSDLTVSVIGFLLQEADGIPNLGYMRSEEWRKWTTVRDEIKYLDLPTANRIRRIVLQAIPELDSNYIEKTNLFNLMDDINLSLDSRNVQLIQGGLDDIALDAYLEQGAEVITGGFPYMTADKGIDIGIGFVTQAVVGAGSQDGAAAATIATIESGRTSSTQKPETYEADSPQCLLTRGYCYMGCVPIRFDRDSDPTTWLDPAARASVNLDIHCRDHADADDGTARVILERFVPY